MESLKERVWGKPAIASTLAAGFGWVSWGLGLAELLTPRALLGWLGVDRRMAPLVRLFGLRETGILQNPLGPQFMWARVAGDALDLLALGSALKGATGKPERVRLALGVIGAITLADIALSTHLSLISASKTASKSA